MPKPSRLLLAKEDILSSFTKTSQKVYTAPQLADVLLKNRHSWRLAKRTSVTDFITFLAKHGELRAFKFSSDAYNQEMTRYSWGKASPFELALSLKSRAYLSHASALTLHGLAKHNRKLIYLNVEQSPKMKRPGVLTQEAIKRAFSGKQRQSNLVFQHNDLSVVIIAGKHTHHLGVEDITGPTLEPLRVTNLERTLIDIVVRPAYAGNVSQMLKAYHAAKERIAIDRLLAILKKLDYLYPYHQPIGFLMQMAGYPEKFWSQLRALGLNHDFYLTHGIESAEYSRDWRLFFPRELR